MSETPTGRFAWYELMTTDPDAAPDFYTKFTDWTAVPWEDGPMPYTMWMRGEVPLGGLMELPQEAIDQGAPSHWLVHISTPDLKATVEKATGMGAKVLGEMTVEGVGSFAIIADPHGAVFAAYQPDGDTPGHDRESEIGEFSWNELMAGDREEAWAFYSGLFGWVETSQMDMGPEHGIYQMYGRGAHPLGGIMTKPAEMPMPPAWLFYIEVADVAASIEIIKANGGKILNGPMEVPGGDLVAQCMDPQGAAFAIHARA